MLIPGSNIIVGRYKQAYFHKYNDKYVSQAEKIQSEDKNIIRSEQAGGIQILELLLFKLEQHINK